MKKYVIIVSCALVLFLTICLLPVAFSFFSSYKLIDIAYITKSNPVNEEVDVYIGDVPRIDFTQYVSSSVQNLSHSIQGYDPQNPIIGEYTVHYSGQEQGHQFSKDILFTFWGFTKFAPGGEHVLGLTSKGEVYVWGSNQYSQLGLTGVTYVSTPTKLTSLPKIKDIAATNSSSFALDESGAIWSWGRNIDNVLGDNGSTRSTPQTINYSVSFKSLAGGGYNTMGAIGTDNYLYAWGNGKNGALGNGVNKESNTVTRIYTGGTKMAQYSFNGGMFTNLNDELFIFGSNDYGEMMSTNYSLHNQLPNKVTFLGNIKKLAAGYGMRMILNTNNNVWTWGDSRYNAVGHNISSGERPNPQQIATNAKDIAMNIGQGMVLKNDGSIIMFGENFSGQNASGSTAYTFSNSIYNPTFSTDAIYCLNETNLFFSKHQMYGVGQGTYGVLANGSTADQLATVQWVFNPNPNAPFSRRMIALKMVLKKEEYSL
ncbi:MAG: hypothetical protein LBV55_01540 [Acholeplasmatales bacterium]|jgi:alpha-tubulin suppressor-like RCC1 family protein|nr:hypothetical protein [Acholeplasmatales bacterium]